MKTKCTDLGFKPQSSFSRFTVATYSAFVYYVINDTSITILCVHGYRVNDKFYYSASYGSIKGDFHKLISSRVVYTYDH